MLRCAARSSPRRFCGIGSSNSWRQQLRVRATGAPFSGSAPPAMGGGGEGRPVILLDVMDTLVQDPFFEHMPRYFQLSFKELLASKHPTAWVEFERGEISQDQLFAKFFSDGRTFDGPGLVSHMVEHYEWLPGMEALLGALRAAGYPLHACSNYPDWWRLIEGKLELGRYVDWTFVSCCGPMKGLRKPSPECYAAMVQHLQVPPEQLLLVDDRLPNVEGAVAAGLQAIRFESGEQLEAELRRRGLQF